MEAKHGGEVVGVDGAVIRYIVKDIPVYLGQKASCNSVASLRILVLISNSERRAELNDV